MLNLLNENKNQIQELKETVKKYEGQDIIITSVINGEDFSYRSQIIENVEVTILDKGVCFEDENEDGNRFEFAFDKMEDTYISEMNIFTDEEEEINEVNVMFGCKGMKYSIINLV